MQDQQITPAELLHLRREIRGEPRRFDGMQLLVLLLEVRRVLPACEVPPVRHRVEPHRVQVRYAHLVAAGVHRLDAPAEERSVEALRFGMRMDEEDVHRHLSVGLPQAIPCQASRWRTFSHEGVMRKLSSMFATMLANFRMGTAKVRTSDGT